MTDTAAEPQLSDTEILDRLDRVILSIVDIRSQHVDMAALRSLPRWRAVTMARVAYKAQKLTKAELDAIVREAAVLANVRPAKTDKVK